MAIYLGGAAALLAARSAVSAVSPPLVAIRQGAEARGQPAHIFTEYLEIYNI